MAESISSSISTDYSSVLQNLSSSTSSSTSSENLSTEEILQELQKDASASTMSAQKIADKYGITLSKAQEILDKLQGNENEQGYTIDNSVPDDSTVSYHV